MDQVQYTIIRKAGKRGATLTVQPDNKVLVSVPKFYSDSMIQEILRVQAGWIAKKTAAQQIIRKKFPVKRYASGDIYHFLGKECRLNLQFGERRQIEKKEEELTVSLPENLPTEGDDSLPEMIQAWYESQAQTILQERVRYYEEKMALKGGALQIKTLRSFWGSCSRDGSLNFNSRIIMAPLEIVDYVVVHELSHLVHRNHSYRFWNLVSTVLPNYGERRRWLTKHGNFLTF
jgi:predicted metal-dependent hydrolase